MREIKFKGKSDLNIEEMDELGIPHDKNGWVYGNLVDGYIVGDLIEVDEEYIAFEWWVSVQQGTVCEYTGFKDTHGKEIYEGDIVKCITVTNNQTLEYVSEVVWDEDCYIVHESKMMDMPIGTFRQRGGFQCLLSEIEVIGNIYENQELPEEGKQC